jgi:hypothetical protein
MSNYCLVENNQITAGPKSIPTSWKNISGLNLLDDTALKARGWLPYIDTKPAFNVDTQYLSNEKIISENAVTETYTINNYTEEQITGKFTTEQSNKLSDLYANVKRFISYRSNGWPRYDSDLKLNVMNASMTAIAAGNPKPDNCQAVETWIYTVQTDFFALKTSISGATTLEALRAIDVTTDYFEGKYGREGTTLNDPGISTNDLFV